MADRLRVALGEDGVGTFGWRVRAGLAALVVWLSRGDVSWWHVGDLMRASRLVGARGRLGHPLREKFERRRFGGDDECESRGLRESFNTCRRPLSWRRHNGGNRPLVVVAVPFRWPQTRSRLEVSKDTSRSKYGRQKVGDQYHKEAEYLGFMRLTTDEFRVSRGLSRDFAYEGATNRRAI